MKAFLKSANGKLGSSTRNSYPWYPPIGNCDFKCTWVEGSSALLWSRVVHRPFVVNFHIFDFSSEITERNSTKLNRKQELNILYQVCFGFFLDRSEKQDSRPGLSLAETFSTSHLKPLNGIQRNLTGSKISTSSTQFVCLLLFFFLGGGGGGGGRKNKMAALASDWLSHFWLLLWNRWTEFNKIWQETRFQCPLPCLCFSGRSEKQDGRPDLWFAETFSTSPLNPLNWTQRNLTGRKISTSSAKFVFFRADRKTRWPPWHLLGWDNFDFSSDRNSTKFDRKQDFNVLYQVWVFRADRKSKIATLASDWLRHFRLLLWNRWTEFNGTWLEARSHRPLSSLCFSGGSEKQDCRSGLWLTETFSTSPLKPLNRIQRNLTGSKILTSSTNFVFFGPISKQKWWQIVLRCKICGPLGLLFKHLILLPDIQ